MEAVRFLLDTCVCIEVLRGNRRIAQRLSELGSQHCAICEITRIELLYGVELNRRRYSEAKTAQALVEVGHLCGLFKEYPISTAIDEIARQKAQLARRGKLIEDADIYIGCTALVHDLTLVTDNVKHLARIDGLRMENWME